ADLRAPTPSAAAELVVRSKGEIAAEVEGLSRRLCSGMTRTLERRRNELHRLLCLLKHPPLMIEHRSQRVDDLTQRLQSGMERQLYRRGQALLHVQRQLQGANPVLRLERSRLRLETLHVRLEQGALRSMERARERVAAAAGTLEALSPLRTLARGYSITTTLPGGEVVVDAAKLAQGNRIRVRLHRGSVEAVVSRVLPQENTEET
ncbi:MAG TPA: exodeoxyribonuclease VII large subunit, partial [Verrucomicrobiae bacterium]|nr:exodeoxyribonuclease VII large subunit [Verrucomicrobiae bacterium]